MHLYYDVHDGTGPYMLMVHGFLSSRAQWGPNLTALARVARPVVLELCGHGPTIQALLAVPHGPAPSGSVPIAHDSTGSHGPSACKDQYHRGHHSRGALWRVGSFLLSLGEKVRVREFAALGKRPLSGS